MMSSRYVMIVAAVAVFSCGTRADYLFVDDDAGAGRPRPRRCRPHRRRCCTGPTRQNRARTPRRRRSRTIASDSDDRRGRFVRAWLLPIPQDKYAGVQEDYPPNAARRLGNS